MATVEKKQTGGIPMTETERRICTDIEWADQNDELQAKYGGQWIAILDRKVVAHGVEREDAVRDAVAATNRPEEELAIWPMLSPGELAESLLAGPFISDEIF